MTSRGTIIRIVCCHCGRVIGEVYSSTGSTRRRMSECGAQGTMEQKLEAVKRCMARRRAAANYWGGYDMSEPREEIVQ